MQIEDYIDVAALDRETEFGWVTRRYHKALPLVILCYSRQTTLEDHWNDVTIRTRGLIADSTGQVIARPYEKFFNLAQIDRPETWMSNLPKEQPFVQEKMDGSLGIIWEYQGQRGIATKGSFHSEQAEWATAWYHDRCSSPEWPVGYTPIVEIVSQEVQRHPVYYDAFDDNQLYLLALINNETGEEASPETLSRYGTLNNIPVVESFSKTVGTAINEDRKNKEGYVLSWPRKGRTPLKVKVKHPSFLKLQRVMHHATPKRIFQAMAASDTGTLKDWNDTAEPSVQAYIEKWMSEFLFRFRGAAEGARRTLELAKQQVTAGANPREYRAQIAAFLQHPGAKFFAPVAFALLDGSSTEKFNSLVWKLVGKHLTDLHSKPMLEELEETR